MGPFWVAVTLTSSFVGGTSIIGTAQAAYQVGVSAIWFTLGAGLGSLVLALGLAGPLREAGVETIPGFLARTYGPQAAAWASFYISLGALIQMVVQVLAAVPILTSLFPLEAPLAAGLIVVLLVVFIFFGGLWGSGLVGLLKTVLLYIILAVAFVISLDRIGGLAGLRAALPPERNWFDLAPGGWTNTLGSTLSAVIGFTSTQNYLQVIFAGRDARSSSLGALAAAILIPLSGLASAVVGVFMRVRHSDLVAATSMPRFLLQYLPSWLGGVGLATLLIALIHSGSSQLLGISTTVVRDLSPQVQSWAKKLRLVLLRHRWNRGLSPETEESKKQSGRTSAFPVEENILRQSRLIVIVVGSSVLLLSLLNLNTLILRLAFLSMALRGTTIFLPMLATILFPGRVHPRAGFLAISLAPPVLLLWAAFFPRQVDPLYVGLTISASFLFLGGRSHRGEHGLTTLIGSEFGKSECGK
ncbi:MAG: sodium:solute symporter family protein [Firmicutes bacterium]|nr:sodium:solute symporter family protein [Bacillota bacterium]